MRDIQMRMKIGFIFLSLIFLNQFSMADSVTPPENYNQSRSIMLRAIGEVPNADVLLIQSALPWNSSADLNVLDALDYTHNTVDMGQLQNVQLADYQIILIVNDQNQQFYDYYAQNYDTFVEYVQNGGILVFFACDHGWADGDNYTNLPGGIVVGDKYNSTNIVTDNSNEIVTGILTGKTDTPILDADLDGTYCSHNYFDVNTLPKDTKVIFSTGDEDQLPTLIEYPLGAGHVIASGLTWEYTYDRFTKEGIQFGFGRALPDVFKYAFSIASGQKAQSGYSFKNVYADDNSIDQKDRKTTFKQPGDILDIATQIEYGEDANNTDANLTLKIEISPVSVLDTDKLRVFHRATSRDRTPTLMTDFTHDIVDDKLIVTIKNIETIAVKNPIEFVVRTWIIKDDATENTAIKLNASLFQGNNKVDTKSIESDFVKIIKDAPLILINKTLLYKKYVYDYMWVHHTTANNMLASIEAFWQEIYSVASERNAAVYNIEKYHAGEEFNQSNIFVAWDKNKVDYTKGITDVNKVSNLLDGRIEDILKKTSKNSATREVALIGDDDLIPYYRSSNDSAKVKQDESVYGSYEDEAKNGYMLTDEIYRKDSYRKDSKGNHTISVGRIMANSLDNMTLFIRSSNQASTSSGKVVMLENAARDFELTPYVNKSLEAGYDVISSINGVDFNHSSQLKKHWWTGNWGSIEDDKARWDNSLQYLFADKSQQYFDIFRMVSHGSINAVQSSESFYSPYFTSAQLENNLTCIQDKFESNPPFFIFDNCLVGLPDKDSISRTVGSMGVRGMIASTTVTTSSILKDFINKNKTLAKPTQYTDEVDISHFNDLFYDNFVTRHTAGSSLNKAINTYKNDDSREPYQVNLYGLPWATTPLANRIGGFDFVKVITIASIQRNRALNNNNLQISKEMKFESYEKVEVDSNYTVISIPETSMLEKDEMTPVVPFVVESFEIPKDATISKIDISASDKIDIGKVEIPAFHHASQIVNATDFSRYVDLPSDVGILPTTPYSYRVAQLVDRKIVFVTLYPVVHDASSKETYLYKNFTIDMEYASTILGTVNVFAMNKSVYSPSEEGWTTIEIKNMSVNNENYTIDYQITNENGEVVSNDSKVVNIDADSASKGDVAFNVPSTPGQYKILFDITDSNGNNIGSHKSIFKVTTFKVLGFEAPIKLSVGQLSTFEVEIENMDSVSINLNVSVGIYDGANLLVNLPQVTLKDIAAGEIVKKQLQWIPDQKVQQGIYLAVVSFVGENEKALSDAKKIYISGSSFDFNQDGVVDKEDLRLMDYGWGHKVGEDQYSYEYDIDLDGDMDILDIMSVVNHL